MIDYVEIDDRVKVSNISDLIRTDVCVHVNRFNEGSLKQFKEDFAEAHETGQEIIPITIDSYGGQAYSLLAMLDIIKSSNKKIATVAIGKAMSCGSILLTAGDDGLRFASPNATIMIHDVSAGTFGKVEEIKSDVGEAERLNQLVFSIMEKNIGFKKGELLSILRTKHNSSDWYITPQQAKKLSIINHVRVPKLITKVIVKTDLV